MCDIRFVCTNLHELVYSFLSLAQIQGLRVTQRITHFEISARTFSTTRLLIYRGSSQTTHLFTKSNYPLPMYLCSIHFHRFSPCRLTLNGSQSLPSYRY